MPIHPDSTDAATAETEIRALLDNQTAAWNRGDLEGFMAGYWRSAELTLSSGKEHYQGWQTTLDRYRSRYQGDSEKMGHLTLGSLDIGLLGSDVALVRGRWYAVNGPHSMDGLFTLVLRRFAEGWRIVHDHTSA
jgi:beta-aspartyl-peptidase (threonine type)